MKSLQLLAAAGILVSSAIGADFFPLQTGNTWTYREAKTAQTFTVKVGLPYAINEKVYYRLSGYVDSAPLVRVDETRQLVFLNEELGLEQWLTSFEAFEGGWWDSPFRTCADWGQTLVKRGTHDGPAGPISGVLEMRYRTLNCADAGVQAEQYAENIGMVRRVTNSIAGPRTYDLVTARVGKVRIDATVSGQFRVSVESGAGDLAITLALGISPNEPLKLQFPSRQLYDVALRDSDGREVWKWSADKVFSTALVERALTDGWSAAVSVPRPPPGAYTVHAWLTTKGDVPQFAATAAARVE